jgi:hypothetical protein
MKKLIYFIGIIFLSTLSYGQTYEYEISKEFYEKIEDVGSFNDGCVYFKDSTAIRGKIARMSEQPLIKVKHDGRILTFSPQKFDRIDYYLDNGDTKTFVVIDLGNERRNQMLEIVLDGEIKIYRDRWIEMNGGPIDPFSREFVIKEEYYIEKDNNLIFLWNYKKDLLPLISDCNKTKKFISDLGKIKRNDIKLQLRIIQYYNKLH